MDGGAGGFGQHGFDVHRGRSVPGAFGDLVCFAGRGPGEVFHGLAKVVGLSQWRAREGALFSSCAYLRWDPGPLLALLDLENEGRAVLARDLAPLAVGLAELEPPAARVARPCGTACWTRCLGSGDAGFWVTQPLG